MTADIEYFDTIPITIPGVYRFRADCCGEGDVYVSLTKKSPMARPDHPGPLCHPIHFSHYERLQGAGWHYKYPLAEA